MGCSVAGGGIETQVRNEYNEPTGILAGHAYSINDVFELDKEANSDGSKPPKRDKHRLLRIRNPWGKCEWNGKWSDGSE